MANDHEDPLADFRLDWNPPERKPPTTDPWDDYALEKLQSFLIGEELYLDDTNRSFTFWVIGCAVIIAITFGRVIMDERAATTWEVVSCLCAILLAICFIALRLFGRSLRKRIDRHQKQLARLGVRYVS